ncbi:MerR family transcriptional regulator [Vibrio hangzhouensis]|uniref:MerR family transcriptional regulator n=1 Tax=Vibrio hangzhouensis TaxID=462991 RepID=UPI001C94A6F0|nr:MerR family transcriptional regulator [Vibrio hangzhouensis]MBY6196005.1 MerR family transcriptional regulator [Vibrio hangzhouensis]
MDCKQSLYAIREVSDMTGVKPVTLRAWQRRYNLLQPLRTDKGHRMYTAEDVERIYAIQGWLGKGVSIGKVKALLDSDAFDTNKTDINQLEEVELLHDALSRLDGVRVEQILASVLKEYPLEIVESKFVAPILSAIEFLKVGPKVLQRSMFKTALIKRLCSLSNAADKRGSSASVLLVNMDVQGNLFAWLEFAKLAESGNRVTFLDGVDDITSLFQESEGYDSVYLFAEKSLAERHLDLVRLHLQQRDNKIHLSPVVEHLVNNKKSNKR